MHNSCNIVVAFLTNTPKFYISPQKHQGLKENGIHVI